MIVIKMIGNDRVVKVRRVNSSVMRFLKRALVDNSKFDETVKAYTYERKNISSISALLIFEDESICIHSSIVEYEVYVDGILMFRS